MATNGLVLTRRECEEIWIGPPEQPDVTVRVVSVGRHRVVLQVKAAPHVEIHRREVAEQKRADAKAKEPVK